MYLFSLFSYNTFVFGSQYILIGAVRLHLTRVGCSVDRVLHGVGSSMVVIFNVLIDNKRPKDGSSLKDAKEKNECDV